MTNTVIIIHGWEGSPDEPMISWLTKELEKNNFKVIVPLMPNPEEPIIKDWVDKITEVTLEPGLNTYFIGHSIGCQAILRYLETLDNNIKIGGAVFIAPWMHLDENTLVEEGESVIKIAKPWTETPINWTKIKNISDKFVCLFSDNDKYSTPESFEIIKNNLSPKIIQEHNKGHYDKESGIKDNPTALKELINISRN